MSNNRLKDKVPHGFFRNVLFGEMKEGDIKSFPHGTYKTGSLRSIAGQLNTQAGYTRYSISDDRLTGTVRIACNAR